MSPRSAAPLLAIAIALGACSLPVRPPNIILVVFDDLGFGVLPSYVPKGLGGLDIRTPVLDELASEGLRVTQAYSNSSVCTPSRAAILTGRYPFALGLRWIIEQNRPRLVSRRGIPEAIVTLPELLEDAGYATAHFGKWHVGIQKHQLPRDLGFGRSVIKAPARNLHTTKTYLDRWLLEDDERLFQSAGHFDAVITDYALSFVRDHAERPFFLNVWYNAPHSPLEAPTEFAGVYEPTARGNYAALVSHADAQIGRILSVLDELNLREETVVIVTSDNGGTNIPFARPNEPLRGDKGKSLEGGIRVPLLIRYSGVTPPGAVSDAVVMGFDLMPTIAELAGIDVSDLELDGASQAELLRTGRTTGRLGPLFWDGRSGRKSRMAVRDGPLKLVRYASGMMNLFDIEVDPREATNLLATNRPKAAAMLRDFLTWRREVASIPVSVHGTTGAVSSLNDGWEFRGGGVEFESDPLLDFHDGEFTVEMQISALTRGGRQSLVEVSGSWRISIEPDGRLRVGVFGDREDGEAVVHSLQPVEAGRPYDVAFTFQGGRRGPDRGGRRDPGALRLYVNGEIQGMARNIRAAKLGRGPLRAGGTKVGSDEFHGSLVGLRFFSAMLTEDDSVARHRAEPCDVDNDGDCDDSDRVEFERSLGLCLGGLKSVPSYLGRGYLSRLDADLDGCVTERDWARPI